MAANRNRTVPASTDGKVDMRGNSRRETMHAKPPRAHAEAMLLIQPLQQRDTAVAQRLQLLFALAYEQEAAELGAPAPDLPGTRSVEAILASSEFYLGASQDGELVGALTIGSDTEPEQIAITTLVVHPNHQRRGIGRSLVQEALARGAGLVFSVTAGANNGPALALYTSLGFVQYRKGILGQADLPMIKLRKRAP